MTLDDVPQQTVTVTIRDTSLDPTPTYALASSSSVVGEGSAFTITVNTTNVADSTTIPYTITGVSVSDIEEALTGNFTITSNTDTITITTVADEISDGIDELILTLDGLGVSVGVTINDTSTEPSPTPSGT